MDNKPGKSLADYVTIAISPVLIMALVGSLVFFLVEVLYAGKYPGSIRYVLFFFVFGAVLVARISMQAGISDRAGLYGIVLGLVAWLALLRFVEYPEDSPLTPWNWAINLGLIAIIWWCAHRLTWDCTLIDDDVDASGSGLLQSAGLEKPTAEPVAADLQSAGKDTESRKKKSEPADLLGWFDRYHRYQERRRKEPHTPGVWVVYFSLAALPLFGLGQAQVPPDATARRQYTFQLVCVYIGSGVGLLLTTSFLGLRRYLRQRNLRMPAAVTTAWLTLGVFLIALMLGVGALLPRPADPNPWFKWPFASSTDRGTSRFAQVGDGKEKSKDEDATRTEKGQKKDGDSKSTSREGDKTGDKREQGDASGKDGQRGKEAKGSDKSKEDEKKETSDAAKKENEKKEQGQGREKKEQRNAKRQEKDSTAPRERGSSPQPGQLMSQAASILKSIVIAILVVLVAFFLLRSGLRFLANFTDWARRLLNALQAWWQGLTALWPKTHAEDEGATQQVRAPPQPFSSYANPFLSGRAESMSPAELIRYSFEALEAWARDHGLERHDPETPSEFVSRLGDEIPRVEESAQRLTGLYVNLAYSQRTTLPASFRESVRVLWQALDGSRADRELAAR
jgi:hypothetical protein